MSRKLTTAVAAVGLGAALTTSGALALEQGGRGGHSGGAHFNNSAHFAGAGRFAGTRAQGNLAAGYPSGGRLTGERYAGRGFDRGYVRGKSERTRFAGGYGRAWRGHRGGYGSWGRSGYDVGLGLGSVAADAGWAWDYGYPSYGYDTGLYAYAPEAPLYNYAPGYASAPASTVGYEARCTTTRPDTRPLVMAAAPAAAGDRARCRTELPGRARSLCPGLHGPADEND
jgi:hypothetical protein